MRAPADGYTLLMVGPTNAINATLYDKLTFDFMRDIAPVAGIMRVPNVMAVHPSVPAKSVPEFIAYAKANPGKINMASGGTGTSVHISGELFKMMTGVDLVHVPYRGAGPALADLIGGQVQVMFDNMPSSIGHIQSRQAARAGGDHQRSGRRRYRTSRPSASSCRAMRPAPSSASARPRPRRRTSSSRLNDAINAVLADPKIKARFADLGGTALPGSPAEFGKLIADETEKWAKVVKFSGVKPD